MAWYYSNARSWSWFSCCFGTFGLIQWYLFQHYQSVMGDHKHKKKSKKEHKKHKKSKHHDHNDSAIDYNDPSLWVEAGASASPSETAPQQPSTIQREAWMVNDGFDFGSLGTAREKPDEKPKIDPDQVSTRMNNNLLCNTWFISLFAAIYQWTRA